MSIWHWLIVLIVAVAVIYPAGRILGRMGLSPWWGILVIIPYVNFIALWVLAFARWPVEERRVQKPWQGEPGSIGGLGGDPPV